MKKLVAFVVLLTAVGLVVWGTTRSRDMAWTTCCEDAREAFDAALEANRRYYHDEAGRRFEKAVELDPNFAVANLMLAQHRATRTRDRSDMIRVIEATDVTVLNPRERLFFEIARARMIDRQPETVAALLEAYLERYPEDPYAIDIKCERAWLREEREDAERCYQRLLEIDPNWVSAQNRLGYVALAAGQFAEAEERFNTYRYIAPDQANPHDSLGELMMVQGRWAEAEASLFKALETHPEFCVSWENLSDIGLYRNDIALARQRIEQARGSEPCRNAVVKQWCRVVLAESHSSGVEVDELTRSTCLDGTAAQQRHAHQLALAAGDVAQALELEEQLLATADGYPPGQDKTPDLAGMRLARALAQKDWAVALEALEAARARPLRGTQLDWFERMMHDLARARVYQELGRPEEAHRLEAAVAKVNPDFAEAFRSGCTQHQAPAPRHVLCPEGVL